MRKITNPYTQLPGYNCFGCSPGNHYGLKMEFFENDDFICCEWLPQHIHQGYTGILHGGIQSALIDEIASWALQIQCGTAGVTSKMEIKFIKPVIIDTKPILIKARFNTWKRNYALFDVFLYNSENVLCSKALVTYYAVDSTTAKEKYYYPGKEAFFQ